MKENKRIKKPWEAVARPEVYEKQETNLMNAYINDNSNWLFKSAVDELERQGWATGFAPSNGKCFNCKKDITKDYAGSEGLTVETLGHGIITSCPHCNRSFCS